MQVFEKLTYLTGKRKVEIRYQNHRIAFLGLFQFQRRKALCMNHSYGKNKQTNKTKGNMRKRVQAAQMKALSLRSEKESTLRPLSGYIRYTTQDHTNHNSSQNKMNANDLKVNKQVFLFFVKDRTFKAYIFMGKFATPGQSNVIDCCKMAQLLRLNQKMVPENLLINHQDHLSWS